MQLRNHCIACQQHPKRTTVRMLTCLPARPRRMIGRRGDAAARLKCAKCMKYFKSFNNLIKHCYHLHFADTITTDNIANRIAAGFAAAVAPPLGAEYCGRSRRAR